MPGPPPRATDATLIHDLLEFSLVVGPGCLFGTLAAEALVGWNTAGLDHSSYEDKRGANVGFELCERRAGRCRYLVAVLRGEWPDPLLECHPLPPASS